MTTCPGLFEPFPDWVSDGNSASSLNTFKIYGVHRETNASNINNKTTKRAYTCIDDPSPGTSLNTSCVPVSPNLVSTVLADCEMTAPTLKRLLIIAAGCCCTYTPVNTVTGVCMLCSVASSGCVCGWKIGTVDPRIEVLVGSSLSYSYPVLTLGEIFIIFLAIGGAVSFVFAVGIVKSNGRSISEYINTEVDIFSGGKKTPEICKASGGCPTTRSNFLYPKKVFK